jgi:hypothetical protein
VPAFRTFIRVSAALVGAAFAAGTAIAQSASGSGDGTGKLPRAVPRPNPAHLETEGSATDIMYHFTNTLNDVYDQYLQSKKELQDAYQIQYSALASTFPQWGVPKAGPGVVQFVYSSNITWHVYQHGGRIRLFQFFLPAKPILDQGQYRFPTNPPRPDHDTQ